MRVSDDRYSRDQRSFHLAMRMLRFDARTNTICAWTGFTAERVRNLSKSYHREHPDRELERHRGPSPTNLAPLLSSPGLRSELAAVAGLCRVLGVIPEKPLANARRHLPSVPGGERLCHALELFQETVPHARVTFEQAVLLVMDLAEAERWSIGHCASCRAVILLDQLSLDRRVCVHCQQEARTGRIMAPPETDPEGFESLPMQQDLFQGHEVTASEGQDPQERVVDRQE